MTVIERVIEYFKEKMKDNKTSFQELADACNVKIGTLKNKFTMKRLSVEDIINICDYFDLSLTIKDNKTGYTTFNFNNTDDITNEVIAQRPNNSREPIQVFIPFNGWDDSMLKLMSKSRQEKIKLLESTAIEIKSRNFGTVKIYGENPRYIDIAKERLEKMYNATFVPVIHEVSYLSHTENGFDVICQPNDDGLKQVLSNEKNVEHFKDFFSGKDHDFYVLSDEILIVIEKLEIAAEFMK